MSDRTRRGRRLWTSWLVSAVLMVFPALSSCSYGTRNATCHQTPATIEPEVHWFCHIRHSSEYHQEKGPTKMKWSWPLKHHSTGFLIGQHSFLKIALIGRPISNIAPFGICFWKRTTMTRSILLEHNHNIEVIELTKIHLVSNNSAV